MRRENPESFPWDACQYLYPVNKNDIACYEVSCIFECTHRNVCGRRTLGRQCRNISDAFLDGAIIKCLKPWLVLVVTFATCVRYQRL